jgi:2,3-bisphosphoglycerate-dependent phosphoglycerate mutase
VLVRNCESNGNLAGTLTGWMDVKLSDFGRKQAFKLSECLADAKFDTTHSSDLLRSIDTSFFATGFSDNVARHRLLRELNFGEHEGLHFDGLPPKEKARFADPNF